MNKQKLEKYLSIRNLLLSCPEIGLHQNLKNGQKSKQI